MSKNLAAPTLLQWVLSKRRTKITREIYHARPLCLGTLIERETTCELFITTCTINKHPPLPHVGEEQPTGQATALGRHGLRRPLIGAAHMPKGASVGIRVAAVARVQIRNCPYSPPWTAPRRCGGQAHTPDPPRRQSGCRSSTLRRIRSESVRGEERTERERRVSELGFQTDEADGFLCGTSVGSVVGRACQADAPGRALATPYPLHI